MSEVLTMTHFRGQIRGPHWGPTMDSMLIDFWRKHDCLFDSSADSYYDKNLKTRLWGEFASSVGKSVSEVERRSRSLRTQYGRVLWHPERVSTAQQEMLREKLAFLRPFIVRRRGDSHVGDKFEDKEELETEGSTEQEMGSSFGSPLDADVTDQDLDDGPPCVGSTPAPLHRPSPQPRVTDIVSLSCPHRHSDETSADQPDQMTNTYKRDLLNQFAQVMLADMRHIKDPVLLMRLRRDITDLVFKAVEEDRQRRRVQVPSTPRQVESVQSRSCSRHPQASSQTDYGRRTRFLKRRRTQRWEDVKHMRRMSKSRVLTQPIPQGQTPEGMSENSSQAIVQPFEIKKETEPHVVKVEEDRLEILRREGTPFS